MPKLAGIAALVIGALLLFYGLNERHSLGSRMKEVLTGSPTDHSTLLIISGVVCAVVGAGLLAMRPKT